MTRVLPVESLDISVSQSVIHTFLCNLSRNVDEKLQEHRQHKTELPILLLLSLFFLSGKSFCAVCARFLSAGRSMITAKNRATFFSHGCMISAPWKKRPFACSPVFGWRSVQVAFAQWNLPQWNSLAPGPEALYWKIARHTRALHAP